MIIKVLQQQIKRLQEHPIVIAIDGHSSSGKSTLAESLSKTLGYIHLDSGAMYRAVALFFLENNVDLGDRQAISDALDKISLRFKKSNDEQRIFLNGKDASKEIRSQRVAAIVSEVAAISAVRRKLVQQQQHMGRAKGIVMDGRDIGTVVFPNAEFKLFVTASMPVRVKRRYAEMMSKGIACTEEEVLANLQHRDHIDSNREDSPLRQADDAILLDTSLLSHEAQLQAAMSLLISQTNH